MTPWLFAIGLVSLLGQVILLRELSVAFYGSELIYILALGVWLLGTAVGASLGRRSSLPSASAVGHLLVVFAWMLPISVALTRGLRVLFGAVPGAYLSFPRQMAGMLLALAPTAFLAGLLFQWAAKRFVDRDRTLAKAYAIESAGAVVGGALATLALRVGSQNLYLALLCSLLSLGAAWLSWDGPRPRSNTLAVPFSALLLLALMVLARPLDQTMTSWNHPQLLTSRDSPYGRITLTSAEDQIAVFENDALAFETHSTSGEELVHIAAVQHPKADSILVLGGGIEGLVAEVLEHDPSQVDYVELNGVLLRLVSKYYPESIRGSFTAPPVTTTLADPRRFLAAARRYDLILVGMPEPESGQVNRFYTREFFQLCAAHLTTDGVLGLRLRGAENLWTPQLARRNASIFRSLASVFADVVVLPGTTNVILASPTRLTRDPDILTARLTSRGIQARLVVPQYLEYLYTNDRFAWIANTLKTTEAPLNTDSRPVCYQYTLMLWLARFYLPAALVEIPELDLHRILRSPSVWIVLVTAAAALLLSRRQDLLRRCLLAAVAGFAGMVLETLLILHYQTGNGVLFQDLGILLTAFMAGLALGAWTLDSWSTRLRRGLGRTLVALFVATSFGIAAMFGSGLGRSLASVSILLAWCGFLVAAVFAYAGLQGQPDQRRSISPLYSADLVGGCVGSLVASLALIPILGLTGSAILVAVTALMALLLP